MKSVFILATVVMMMLVGCGSSSDGSFSTSSVGDSNIASVSSSDDSVVVSSGVINEPAQVSSLPPVPAFPSE